MKKHEYDSINRLQPVREYQIRLRSLHIELDAIEQCEKLIEPVSALVKLLIHYEPLHEEIYTDR